MKVVDLIRLDKELYLLLVAWAFLSSMFNPVAYLIIPVIMVLFKRNKMTEVIISLLFVLILSDSSSSSLAWVKSFKTIFVVALGIVYVLKHNQNQYNTVIFRYFGFFMIFALYCLLFSPVPSQGFQKTLSYFLIFLIVPSLTLEIIRLDGKEAIYRVVTFAFLIVFLGYLLELFGIFNVSTFGPEGRMRGFFGNPNGLGIFLVNFLSLLIASKSIFGKFGGKYFFFITTLFVFFIAAKTGSRGSLMAISALIICVELFKFSSWLGLLFVLTIALLYDYIANFILSLLVAVGLQEELRLDNIEEGSGRLVVWAFAWENIQESFFTGKGFGFDRFLTRSNQNFLSRKGHEGGVHNSYLMIWLNTGLIGLILWLRGMILTIISGAKNSKAAWPILISLFLSAFFEGWLVGSLNPYTSMLLITFTVLASPSILGKEEIKKLDSKIHMKMEST